MTLREQAQRIIEAALSAAQADTAVKKALHSADFSAGKLILVAAGKAAWQMAQAAYEELGERIDRGIVITKYEHSRGTIGNFSICEAGHPVPDENSFQATQSAIDMVNGLCEKDMVLFLHAEVVHCFSRSPCMPSHIKLEF